MNLTGDPMKSLLLSETVTPIEKANYVMLTFISPLSCCQTYDTNMLSSYGSFVYVNLHSWNYLPLSATF